MMRGMLLALAVCSQQAGAQQPAAQDAPVTLRLPPDAAPHGAEIHYFLTGPFGGLGGVLERSAPLVIHTAVEGKRAATLKVIALVPGCEVVWQSLPVGTGLSEYVLPCRRLPARTVLGQIPPKLLAGGPAEVVVQYRADWGNTFFGIMDGMVPVFTLATAVPDSSGAFRVSLPDLSRQQDLGAGGYIWMLRERHTGNTRAWLSPVRSDVEASTLPNNLPASLVFTTDKP